MIQEPVTLPGPLGTGNVIVTKDFCVMRKDPSTYISALSTEIASCGNFMLVPLDKTLDALTDSISADKKAILRK
jgi:hypothetical protein